MRHSMDWKSDAIEMTWLMLRKETTILPRGPTEMELACSHDLELASGLRSVSQSRKSQAAAGQVADTLVIPDATGAVTATGATAGDAIGRTLTATDADGRKETVHAHDLFYWPPGHTVRVGEDAEIILSSPQEEHGKVIDHLREKMAS